MDNSGSTAHPHHRHKGLKILKKIFKATAPVAVTVLLLFWLFHKINPEQLKAALQTHVKFGYILGMMVLTLLSHVVRGIRWGYQLRAVGIPRIPAVAESCSIFGAYALNLLFPYLGEAWRCVYISHRNNVKLSTVVGTDIGDRVSDLIVILLLCGLALLAARRPMLNFIHSFVHIGGSHTGAGGGSDMDITSWVIGGIFAAALIAFLILKHRTTLLTGIEESARRIITGFAALFHMKGTGAYILLTFGIWICYFFQTYLCFFAFPYTAELIHQPGSLYGLIPALVVFVFGSCSMAVPSNGGLGPWNIAVVFGLTLYGVNATDATAWSLVYWGWQTVSQIAGGIFAAVYIARERPVNKPIRK